MAEFPAEGMALSHILVVDDLEAAKDWYSRVLGAKLYREYGGTTLVYDFQGAWLVVVTGGGPTEDKPGVKMAPPVDIDLVGHAMTIRVPDCEAAYETLLARGAEFLTPPVDHETEVRAFFRDPSGHLFEISEAKSV